jgi:potassium-transporting ATPase KdpC subunit
MKKLLHQSLVLLLLMTAITGVLYPLAATGLAQLVFPRQANGSLIVKDGKPIGSALIGQSFTDPKYFWGRPSATSPNAYNAGASSGSNLGPTHPALTEAVKQRIAALRAVDPGNNAPVPVDLVTASGSGLDPEISPAAAQYQLTRAPYVAGAGAGERMHPWAPARHAGRAAGECIAAQPRAGCSAGACQLIALT